MATRGILYGYEKEDAWYTGYGLHVVQPSIRSHHVLCGPVVRGAIQAVLSAIASSSWYV
jgi:hypothetical protein